MISTDTIDFNEISKKFEKTDTSEEIKNLREAGAQLIDKHGLKGFFGNKTAPAPTGIVLDYNVEEIKKELYQ